VYAEVILPMFEKISPRPKFAMTRFLAGTHMIMHPEPDLPMGVAPAIARQWQEAITTGWFASSART
jgi:hypothetical protein